MGPARYRDADSDFDFVLPPGWEVERDGEGGLLVSTEDGAGLLHLMPFERDRDEFLDPADELYAFLEDQDIELEDDEVEDVPLERGAALALCEYVAEETDEVVYWMIGVATAPGTLLFASFSCAVGEEEKEREIVREILASLRFER